MSRQGTNLEKWARNGSRSRYPDDGVISICSDFLSSGSYCRTEKLLNAADEFPHVIMKFDRSHGNRSLSHIAKINTA